MHDSRLYMQIWLIGVTYIFQGLNFYLVVTVDESCFIFYCSSMMSWSKQFVFDSVDLIYLVCDDVAYLLLDIQ